MNAIRVFIVEDENGWIKAITSLLTKHDDILIVGTATNRKDAVNAIKVIACDVVLMDINLGENDRDGILAVAEILESSEKQIIMMTTIKDKETIKNSFFAGAVNFIEKEKYKEIPEAIRLAYHRSSPYEIMLKELRSLKKEEMLYPLTSKEREVFELVEQGFSMSEIEKKMFISRNTINTHKKNILKKLEAASMKEAIIKVKSKGIIEILEKQKDLK